MPHIYAYLGTLIGSYRAVPDCPKSGIVSHSLLETHNTIQNMTKQLENYIHSQISRL